MTNHLFKKIINNKNVIFIILVVICFIPALFFLANINTIELFFLDIKFIIAQLLFDNSRLSPHIAIILIDEKSANDLHIAIEDNMWRQYDSQIITILSNNETAIIAFDIEYSMSKTVWDEELVASIDQAGNVISGEIVENSTLNKFEEVLLAIGNVALVTYRGVPRKVYQYPPMGNKTAFSYAIAAHYLEKMGAGESRQILLEHESSWIDYKYPREYFPVFSYIDVLNSQAGRLADQSRTPLSIFKNKIVIIAKDSEKHPIVSNHNKLIFGGLSQAYTVETLLNHSYLKKVSLLNHAFVLLLFLLVLYIVDSIYKKYVKFFLTLSIFNIMFLSDLVLYIYFNYWFNIPALFFPSLLFLLLKFFYEKWLVTKNLSQIQRQIVRLEAFNAEIRKVEQLKDNLSDTVVHDIKNLISTVETSLHFLSIKYREDNRTFRNVNTAISACSDLLNLSSNLIDIRAIEENKLFLNKKEISFIQIEEIIKKIAGYYDFRSKNISVDIGKPVDDFVIALDPFHFERVINNIINNAFKYTPAGGYIEISFSIDAGKHRITFYNSGTPLTEEQINILFNKYTTLGAKRSRYSKGLGLYYCKIVMNALPGDITAGSDDSGNYFSLVFFT